MKKNTTRALAWGLSLLLLLQMLVGCTGRPYHAELYDLAAEWIQEDFAAEHPVRCWGNSEEADPHPKTRVFLVKDREQYEAIFREDADGVRVDFNSQMLVVYTFSTVYHRENKLTDLTLQDGVLTVTYRMETPNKLFGVGVGDASQPYQRWFVVKLDRLEVDTVIFEEEK